MDILTIMFFIFGCIFKVKGLVIASLILSLIVATFSTYALSNSNKKPKESQKKQTVRLICLVCDIILFGSAIIKLCIW